MTKAKADMDLLVLCGGKGTRLGVKTAFTPKPLLPLGGSPFLLRLLLQWKAEGVERFVLATHHLADQFHEFVHHYAREIGPAEVVVESAPLGTGGGIRNALGAIRTSHFLVANGDSYVSQPLDALRDTHRHHEAPFTMVAVSADKVLGGANQKGNLSITSDGWLKGLTTEECSTEGWINAGFYALRRESVTRWPLGRFDLEKTLLAKPAPHSIRVFRSAGNLMDIGLPDCYERFDHEIGPLTSLFSNIIKPS